MITKSEPISTFVAAYEESGLSLGVFPAKSNPERYVIRAIDPDNPKAGLGYVASFASNVEGRNRPFGKKNPKDLTAEEKTAQREASLALDAALHDVHAGADLEMLTCLVDQESVEKFNFSAEDLGKSFLLVSRINTVFSDSYNDMKAESSAKGAVVRD